MRRVSNFRSAAVCSWGNATPGLPPHTAETLAELCQRLSCFRIFSARVWPRHGLLPPVDTRSAPLTKAKLEIFCPFFRNHCPLCQRHSAVQQTACSLVSLGPPHPGRWRGSPTQLTARLKV